MSAELKTPGGVALAFEQVVLVKRGTTEVVAGPVTTDADGRFAVIVPEQVAYDIQVVDDGSEHHQAPPPEDVNATHLHCQFFAGGFDPARSRWVDVTERAPWGAGARMPLIPFRVLAHNPRTETPLYGKTVYIQQLDGLRLPTGEVHNGMCVVGDCGGMTPAGAQFDFFVGREDRHIQIPTLAASQGGAVCRVEIVGDCAAAHNRGP